MNMMNSQFSHFTFCVFFMIFPLLWSQSRNFFRQLQLRTRCSGGSGRNMPALNLHPCCEVLFYEHWTKIFSPKKDHIMPTTSMDQPSLPMRQLVEVSHSPRFYLAWMDATSSLLAQFFHNLQGILYARFVRKKMQLLPGRGKNDTILVTAQTHWWTTGKDL